MHIKRMLTGAVLLLLSLTACVDEFYFGRSSYKQILYLALQGQVGNATIVQDSLVIRLTVGATADLTALAIDSVRLSSYATIAPGKGVSLNFLEPQQFAVTAENGTTATYTVYVSQEGSTPQLENSLFEDWYTPAGKSYKEPGAGPETIWASANAGAAAFNKLSTLPVQLEGKTSAEVVTVDLGAVAGLVKQRMASGSLFTGKFELNVSNPLTSAKFGVPFTARPSGFRVRYAYTPGSPYLNGTGTVLNKVDSCDIYLLLENRNGVETARVATGWLRSGELVSELRTIDIPLYYGQLPLAAPNYMLPKNGLYGSPLEAVTHIILVFASSANGDSFEGGVGSRLLVYSVELLYD